MPFTTALPRAYGQIDTPAALRYRRVYVPEQRLEDLPRDRNRLVPMPAEEFDRLVSAARSAAASGVLAGGVVSARYQARLEGNRLVDGEAVLDIFHSSKSDSLLPLDPCGLGVRAADWLAPEPQPAVVGLAGDGRLTVLVPAKLSTAKLRLAWSLSGVVNERGTIEFPLALPACGATQFVLDVPAGTTPTIEQAVVSPQSSDVPGMVRWQIELRGGLPTSLRMVPERHLKADAQWTGLRQSTVYGFSPRGVEMTAELRLDAYGEPLGRAVVALDRNVQLVAAHYGDAAIPWTATPSAGPTRVTFALPEPIRGAGRVLRMTAWAPLVLDRVWKLPAVRVENVSWQEGTASLLVPGPLMLTQLDIHDGRQSKTGTLSGPQSGQRVDVQQFTADATIEVVLSRPKKTIDARLGVAVVLGSQQVQALETAALTLAEGERFEIEATVARRWIIDAVETAPADVLDDWTIQREPAGHVLRIRLARPLSPAAPVRLLVRARRLGPPAARGFTSAELSPLEFLDAPGLRQWIWVRFAETFQLKIAGDDASSRADPTALDPDVLALFAESPQEPLFVCNHEDAGWRVLLEPQKPNYSAQIHLQATVSGGMLRETYRFACVPEESRVDRLVVRFSRARDKPLDWTLVGDVRQPLAARRQAVDDSEGGEAPGGETWQIDLDPPESGPFEVRAARATALGDSEPVSLAALPEAGAQEAIVVVDSGDSAAVRVENQRLKPIWTESLPGDRVNPARASFRYDPVAVFHDAASLRRTVLNVAREPSESAPSSAWAWSCRLESWLQPDGAGRHLAVYRLETTGRPELRLDLPKGSDVDAVRGVWVDGARSPWRPWRHDPGGVAVSLPEGRRFPVVAIHYETTGQPLRWTESVAAAWPTGDVPVLARRWTVWLPPDYQGRVPDPAWLLESPARLSWVERLFGPLARPTQRPRFDPTRIGGLRGLAAGPDAAADADDAADDAAVEGAAGSDRSRDDETGPWADAAVAELVPADTTGWSVYDLEVPPDETARLAIVRRDAVQAIGLAVLFGVMALGCWLVSDRPAVLIFLAVAFGIVALVVPETYASLASGAVVGTLLCLGFRFVRRRGPPAAAAGNGPESSSRIGTGSPAGVALVAVALTLALSTAALAQTAAPTAAEASQPVYNVFDPVDDAGQPTGAMVQVSEPLYNELHHRAVTESGGPQGWLLLDAAYYGTLRWQPGGERLALDRLTAVFDVRVFGKLRTVAVPLGGDGARLATSGALLDGRPVQPRWSEPDGLLLVDLDDDLPEHRLEVSLRPTIQTDGTYSRFTLRIPPLAGSEVHVSAPIDAPQVEILSAAGRAEALLPARSLPTHIPAGPFGARAAIPPGETVRRDDPGRVAAALGPSDRFSVRWPDRNAQAPAAPQPDVEELLWLKVRDGSVVLDARFRFSAGGPQGYLSQLELAADPSLRLLPQEDRTAKVTTVETSPDAPQTIRFDLAQPSTEPVVLTASFLVRESSGVGNIRLPYLAAQNARSVKRWLAIWVDPSLTAVVADGQEPVEWMPPSEFEAAWGTSDFYPRDAYVLPPGPTSWSLDVRPGKARIAAEESLILTFAEKDVAVDYAANLRAYDGYAFQYRIAVPERLDIESVSLVADAVEQVVRWSPSPDNSTITAFLAGPVVGFQRLTLHGRMAIDEPDESGSRMPMPVVRLKGIESTEGTVQLFRKPGVRLNVAATQGLTATETTAADPDDLGRRRLVASLHYANAEAIGGTVEVMPNRPRVQADQATAVRFDGEYWDAEVDLNLRVADGLLDELRLSVPPEFAGPYQLDPPAVVEQQPAGDRQQLVIRPRAAVSGDYRLKILSPLDFSSGDRIRAPNVIAEGVELTSNRLTLPSRLEQQAAAWRTQGLQEADASHSRAVGNPQAPEGRENEASVAYQARGQEFEAELRPTQGEAQVRLADVRLAWQADGSCFGLTRFDVELAGRSECVLRLPEGFRLIAVAVADVPAAATAVDATAWQVPLGPAAYPRRVDVLMAGRVGEPDADGRWTFAAPRLDGLKVHETLWTISGPLASSIAVPDEVRKTSPLDQTRRRLASVRQMIAATAAIASGEKGEADHGYRLWANRFVTLADNLESHSRQIERTASTISRLGDSPGSSLSQWDDLVSTDGLPQPAIAMIEAARKSGDSTADTPWSDTQDAAWLGPWQMRGPSLRFVTGERIDAIALAVRPAANRDMWRQWLTPVVLAALAIVGLLAMRTWRLATRFHYWPQLGGVALGLFWWFWLRPSAFGLIIAAVSLISWLRPARPKQPANEPTSGTFSSVQR